MNQDFLSSKNKVSHLLPDNMEKEKDANNKLFLTKYQIQRAIPGLDNQKNINTAEQLIFLLFYIKYVNFMLIFIR